MSVTKNYKEMVKAANIDGLICYYTQVYVNKYYDLYSEQLDIKGLDYKSEYRLKALLWQNGTAWIRKNPVGDPVVCQYAGITWDWNNFPVTVQLTKNRNAPDTEIPMTPQVVDKDGCIVWIRKCHKGYEEDVNYYIGNLAEAQTCITICLALQRMPWLLSTEPENVNKLKQLVRDIMANKLVIYTDIPRNEIDQLNLNAPWIIDKLSQYKASVESEIKTLLGIDNSGTRQHTQQMDLDEVNSNNDEINDFAEGAYSELKSGFERCNKFLGLNLSVKQTSKPVTQIGTSKDSGGNKQEGEDSDDQD